MPQIVKNKLKRYLSETYKTNKCGSMKMLWNNRKIPTTHKKLTFCLTFLKKTGTLWIFAFQNGMLVIKNLVWIYFSLRVVHNLNVTFMMFQFIFLCLGHLLIWPQLYWAFLHTQNTLILAICASFLSWIHWFSGCCVASVRGFREVVDHTNISKYVSVTYYSGVDFLLAHVFLGLCILSI